MKMKQATGHYFPNNNKQAFDMIALSFFIALTVIYLIALGVKLVKAIHSNAFASGAALFRPKTEEYRLTNMGDDEDDMEDDIEEVRAFYQRKRNELALSLVQTRRTLNILFVLTSVVLGMGLYLGIRSISYGMNAA